MKSPDCQNYFQTQIEPSLQILQDANIVNLTLVPFGNAEIDSTRQIVMCQHGLDECDANSYEQCVISLNPSPSQYLPVLFCAESNFSRGTKNDLDPSIIFEYCASGLDFALIKGCHDNPVISWELQEEASKLTPSYHTAVPWVEINGMQIDVENTILSEEICTSYLSSGGSSPLCSNKKRQFYDMNVASSY